MDAIRIVHANRRVSYGPGILELERDWRSRAVRIADN
jgi:hypothetical protein